MHKFVKTNQCPLLYGDSDFTTSFLKGIYESIKTNPIRLRQDSLQELDKRFTGVLKSGWVRFFSLISLVCRPSSFPAGCCVHVYMDILFYLPR